MNIQCSLIQEIMLYKFELGHNAMETTKNIYCMKDENTVHYRLFKKFCLGCKNLDSQVRSGRPKIIDSQGILQIKEANLVSSTQKASIASHSPMGFIIFMTSANKSGSVKLVSVRKNYEMQF